VDGPAAVRCGAGADRAAVERGAFGHAGEAETRVARRCLLHTERT
jgi:hypothetical protein